MPYEELQVHMQRSTFCLLPPGGTASSRRLTDIVLSGCIPVFIGPPWHAMPLAGYADYPTFAVFVSVRSTKCVRLHALLSRKMGCFAPLTAQLASTCQSTIRPEISKPEPLVAFSFLKSD